VEDAREELFDILDESGKVVGRERRSRCHSDPSLIHGAVHVFVTDPAGRIFLLTGEPRFLYRYLWRTDRETELVQTYIMETGETPVTDPEEIDEGRFFSTEELAGLLREDTVTPNLREELRRLGEAGIYGTSG
jgi:isopentenyldiphosphate isomerase